MARTRNSKTPRADNVAGHYDSGYEAERLGTGVGKLDGERSRELLKRFLPPAPAIIMDVGGGPGEYACWLARQGYEVHLIDIVPLHVRMAQQASANQPEAPLASAGVGDACSLPWANETADAVLLFGPLYHLTDTKDRLQALREAFRVLETTGILMAVGISRFASVMDGLRSRFLKDPVFAQIVERDLKNGHHRNPTDRPEYFTDAYFHHPAELRTELAEAGFDALGIYGVEGPGWLLQDFDEWWADETLRARLIRIAQTLETEESLIGISAHLIAVGRK